MKQDGGCGGEATLPVTDDVSTAEADIAAAMGFGSFGSKPHLSKKRKIEPLNAPPSSQSTFPIRPGDDGRSNRKIPEHNNANTPEFEGGRSAQTAHPPPLQDSRVPIALPPKPPSSDLTQLNQHHDHNTTVSRDGKKPDGEWDWYALRRGVQDENGDTAYYDASFVEDPWSHLKDKT